MDFTKFVSLLDSKALFFARADTFDDPFEGSLPTRNVTQRNLTLHQLKKANPAIDPDAFATEESLRRAVRRTMYVNCWHMNSGESAAMWRLYAQTREAVAISCVAVDLDAALPSETKLGIVQYVDYDHHIIPDGNMFWPFVHKRLSFAHEQEVRAVIWRPETNGLRIDREDAPSGIAVPIDLNSFLSHVHVAPTCPGWFKSLVEKVAENYGLNAPVMQSRLDEAAFF